MSQSPKSDLEKIGETINNINTVRYLLNTAIKKNVNYIQFTWNTETIQYKSHREYMYPKGCIYIQEYNTINIAEIKNIIGAAFSSLYKQTGPDEYVKIFN